MEEASTTMEEVQVLLVPTIEGTSKASEAASEELVIIIMQEPPPAITEPSTLPPPKNVP